MSRHSCAEVREGRRYHLNTNFNSPGTRRAETRCAPSVKPKRPELELIQKRRSTVLKPRLTYAKCQRPATPKCQQNLSKKFKYLFTDPGHPFLPSRSLFSPFLFACNNT